MKNTVKIGTMLVFGMLILACKKDNNEPEEEVVTATINFTEPSTNDTIHLNAEIHAEGTISGSSELHGYILTFTNMSTGAILKTASNDAHTSAYNFHEHLVNTVTDTTIVKIKMDVTKDHEGMHEIKEINVVCLPN